MYLCSHNHPEVCHETRNCPVCEIIDDYDLTISDLESTNENLRDEIKELEDALKESAQ